MKKTGIINSDIASIIATLGHTDSIVIADCGLPIPDGAKRIDIALKPGTPSFDEVLETILQEMEVEKAIFAEEMKEKNAVTQSKALQRLSSADIDYIPHEEFKHLTKQAKAVIRTGEATPYANVILVSGVCFN